MGHPHEINLKLSKYHLITRASVLLVTAVRCGKIGLVLGLEVGRWESYDRHVRTKAGS
jgi:hypothetical protein